MSFPHRNTCPESEGEVIQRWCVFHPIRVSAPVDRIDLLIPFSPGAIRHVQKRISPKTILLGEKNLYGNEYQGETAIDVPLSQIASEVGGPIYTNTVAVALLAGLLQVERELLDQYLRHHFAGKEETTVQKNLEAARRGYAASDELLTKRQDSNRS